LVDLKAGRGYIKKIVKRTLWFAVVCIVLHLFLNLIVGPSTEYGELTKKEIQKKYPNYNYVHGDYIGNSAKKTLNEYGKEELEVSYYDFGRAKVEMKSRSDGSNSRNASEEDNE